MASNVSIVNAALIKVGEDVITSLSDDSKPARVANAIFEDTRDALLAAHPWNFALAEAALAAHATSPTWTHTYRFPLPESPSKCLRVLRIEDDDADAVSWKVVGRFIYTDEGAPLNILYIAQITDPGQFPPLFAELLSAKLAAELAESLKASGTMTQTMQELYHIKLAEARMADAQEGTPDVITANEWIDARN
ncbi:MAG: hypothetical protein ACKV2U_03640 [Bryobacteraceae bacterium]